MYFEEPKIEFVEIETDDIIITSNKCQKDGKSGTGSGTDCVGPDSVGNNCSKYNTMMIN